MTDDNQAAGDNQPIVAPAGDDGSLPGGLGEPIDTDIQVPPHPNTTFDEQNFVKLLSGSISLTKTEKTKIINTIPNLKQAQIDRLIEIFKEEKQKFEKLHETHGAEISEAELEKKMEWKDIEAQKAELSEEEEAQKRIAEMQAKLNGE